MDELPARESERISLSRSSLTEIEREEKDALLETGDPLEKRPRERHGVSRRYFIYAVGMLSLSNLVFVVAFIVVMMQKLALQPTDPPSWAPPERHETRLFQYLDVYGGEPSLESEKAWTKLIPSKESSFPV